MFSQHVAATSQAVGRSQVTTERDRKVPLPALRRRRFRGAEAAPLSSAIVRAVLRSVRSSTLASVAPARATNRSGGRRERRRFPRRRGHCVVSVLPTTAGADVVPNRDWAFRAAPLRGTMHDVSMGGVAFVLAQPIEPGNVLEIQLRHPQRLVTLVRRASVVAHHPYGEDDWKILCRFLRPLSFDEVCRLALPPTV